MSVLAWWLHIGQYSEIWGGNRLRRTVGVGIGPAKTIKRYVDFFLAYLIALFTVVSEVSWANRGGSSVLCPGTFGAPFAMRAIDV